MPDSAQVIHFSEVFLSGGRSSTTLSGGIRRPLNVRAVILKNVFTTAKWSPADPAQISRIGLK
ncbi:hypothetical protein EYF80_004800 [Liparis tanakae]|uniref:Uncharacterized protein n=1 Tax=Liparis tanakae TaxID=230148 RepID=A0A4Z2J339_9TELE|nr:hypothetical protein EYF80_004800 [Liparis tanakae]